MLNFPAVFLICLGWDLLVPLWYHMVGHQRPYGPVVIAAQRGRGRGRNAAMGSQTEAAHADADLMHPAAETYWLNKDVYQYALS